VLALGVCERVENPSFAPGDISELVTAPATRRRGRARWPAAKCFRIGTVRSDEIATNSLWLVERFRVESGASAEQGIQLDRETIRVELYARNGVAVLAHSSNPLDQFSVPETHAESFAYLASFGSDRLRELIECLSKLPVQTYNLFALGDALDEFADEAHPSDQLARAVQGLHNTRERFGKTSEADFIESATRATLRNAKVKTNAEHLRPLFVNLLGLRNIGLSVKATRVLMDTERHMHDVSIYTDLRPIFDADGGAINACVLMHTMKLDYSDGDGKEFYVFLDEDDISALEEALVRAKRKAAALRAFAKSSNMKIIGDEP
jgi:hypothetical protein